MKLLQNKKYLILCILANFTIVVFFYPYGTASANYNPTGEWQISTPEEQGIRSKMLAEMMEHIKKNNFKSDGFI